LSADLEARVARLEEELAAVRADLSHARTGAGTARALGRCGNCAGTAIVRQPRIWMSDGLGGGAELSLTIRNSTWTASKPLGPFEVYACTSCGLTEWYVRTFEHIDPDKDGLERVTPQPPSRAPYR
jgi:hypothetical protein